MFPTLEIRGPLTMNGLKSLRQKGQIKFITLGTKELGETGNHNINALNVEFADLIGTNLPEWYLIDYKYNERRINTITFGCEPRDLKDLHATRSILRFRLKLQSHLARAPRIHMPPSAAGPGDDYQVVLLSPSHIPTFPVVNIFNLCTSLPISSSYSTTRASLKPSLSKTRSPLPTV